MQLTITEIYDLINSVDRELKVMTELKSFCLEGEDDEMATIIGNKKQRLLKLKKKLELKIKKYDI